jgi:hypothetical protein
VLLFSQPECTEITEKGKGRGGGISFGCDPP